MEVRTCPHCNYKYSISNYFKKLFFKFVWSKWDCPNCSEKITFDFKRRILVALGSGVWLIAIFLLKSQVVINLYWLIVLVLLLSFGVMLLFTFDTFKKPEKSVR